MVQRAGQRQIYDDLSTGDMAEELMSPVGTHVCWHVGV